jgi:hypothetical protein
MSGRNTFAAALLLALLVPLGANGWEQTESDLGLPLYWPVSCYHYSLHADGSDDVSFEDLSAVTRAAFDTWEDVDCAYFYFQATEPAQVDEQAYHEDKGNANLLVWRETAAAWPYSPMVVALTSVHYDPANGLIRDVDIEFNGYDFEFGTLDEYPVDSPLVDLQSTMTHEIGHTLGLGHSGVEDATMAPYGELATTEKRTLADDDIEGVCSLYPLEQDPDVCEEPVCGLDLSGTSDSCGPANDTAGGCSCSAVGKGPPRVLALLDALLTQLGGW